MKRFTARWATIVGMSFIGACSWPPEVTNSVDQLAIGTVVPKYASHEFHETTSLSGSSINSDNRAILVTSDSSGVYNVYRYPVNGSPPTQLTHSTEESNYAVSWFPEDDRFLYKSDQGGNELYHLYVRETDGRVRDLTPGERLQARFLGWSQDGSRFYIATNERHFTLFDIYSITTEGYERTLLYENIDALNFLISPNGRWLALLQPKSNNDGDVYLVDLSTTAADRTKRLISRHDGAVRFTLYTFSPDSLQLILGSDENSEYQQAWAYHIDNGSLELLSKQDWDISFVHYSKTGNYRVIGTNANAKTVLTLQHIASGKSIQLPKLPEGDIHSVRFSGDGRLLAFYLDADNAPSNLYIYHLQDKQLRQLTEALNPALQAADLISSDVVQFSSFDGLSIPGLIYRPHEASVERPVPALIMIHGGPGSQSRKGYNATLQHLLNHGYAIFAINNRGSSGYGKTFFHLDDKRHGEVDLQDIVYGKKYLQSLEWIDGSKIGVMGQSYGGFLTMAAMAFTNEFAVGIDIYGVTNWERTLNSIPPWLESFRKPLYDEMGDPATDGARHRRMSPLFHAEKISNPVLIVQGANDPRVLQIESDEMVTKIRDNGVFVEYLLFPDEGHGLKKKNNRIMASEAYLKFLNTYLSEAVPAR